MTEKKQKGSKRLSPVSLLAVVCARAYEQEAEESPDSMWRSLFWMVRQAGFWSIDSQDRLRALLRAGKAPPGDLQRKPRFMSAVRHYLEFVDIA